MIATNFNAFSRAEHLLREMLNSTPEEIAERDKEKQRRKELRKTAVDGKPNFGLYTQLEQQLQQALEAIEPSDGLTRTERTRLRKAARLKPKQPQSIYVAEKTTIRFSCLPFSGPTEIHEFSYYTPFMNIAEEMARKALAANGKKYRFVTLLDKDKV